MAVKAKLPTGIENFREMRTHGYYYVDKTGLIRDLLENFGKVNLFTRPSRFGKTLNISMLKYFLRLEATEDFLTDLKFQGKKSCAIRIWAGFRLFLFP